MLGVDEKSIRNWVNKVQTQVRTSLLPECFQPFAHKPLRVRTSNQYLLLDAFVAALAQHFAFSGNIQAQKIVLVFSAIGIRTFFQKIKNWQQTETKQITTTISNKPTLEQIDYIFAGLTKLGIKSELVESAKLTAVAQIFPNLAAATESAKALLSSKMAIEDIPVSPTKIGELLAKELHLLQVPSARLVNQALVDRGLQKIEHNFNSKGKKKISYHLTERGEAFGQMQLETAQNCRKTLTIVRWFPKVVQEIKNYFNRT
jgi:hypothetical protein